MPILPAVALLGLGEASARLGWVPRFLLPAPSAVWGEALQQHASIGAALRDTAVASVAGLGLSVVVGVAVAVLLSSAWWVRQMFYPYAVFLQTVPVVAVAPLLVIWVGYGLPSVITAAFLVSLFPVIANALAGLEATDPALVDLFRLHRGGIVATLLKLRFPSALPQFLTGLRVAAGLSVIGAIVGEFICGGGIGGLIFVAKGAQNTPLIFALLLVSALLGIALFGVVNLLSHALLRRWHVSEQ